MFQFVCTGVTWFFLCYCEIKKLFDMGKDDYCYKTCFALHLTYKIQYKS